MPIIVLQLIKKCLEFKPSVLPAPADSVVDTVRVSLHFDFDAITYKEAKFMAGRTLQRLLADHQNGLSGDKDKTW